ncbi:SulP family inorganic anion transporter [Methylocystis sp. ATCC 49242]|uniref:SulP family inorganic anion transporter n=1 Tax=Methylocystis sp. ATCC 49242 TaxID=622637 RepID=UPI0001F875DE|nr:SulP family inorganic anion transporter [Methylocystis sp. ATCC 49242]
MSAVTSQNETRRFYLKEDLLASFVVFLVALPLSLGLALVAGYPFEKAAAVGLISGAIGGVVVGFFSGCALQVSGAANGAAVTVAAFASELGFEALGLIVMLAGVIQLAGGALRLGPVFRAVSPALIQGMLAGIGILIFASQFHVMVDDTPPGTGKEFGGVINLWSISDAVLKGFTVDAHRPAALIGLVTIGLIVLWNDRAPRMLKMVPAPLVGVGVATFIAWRFGFDVKYVPAPDRLIDAISFPDTASFARVSEGAIWIAALTLAFVSGAESLLTATAVDAMQRHTPRTRYNKELIAQGVGNFLCGAIGVLPVSGVIVRSSANVMAGARTRLSTMLHGVWILLFITMLPDVLRMIPVASLAAVLVYAGAKLIKLGFLRNLWQQDRAEAGIYAVTLGMVVATDVLTGIAVGVGLALARLLYTFSTLEISVEEDKESGKTEINLRGAATFIRLPQLASALEALSPDAHIQVHLHDLNYIDHACLDLLLNWHQQHQSAGGELTIDWDELHGLFQQKAWGDGNGVARMAAT